MKKIVFTILFVTLAWLVSAQEAQIKYPSLFQKQQWIYFGYSYSPTLPFGGILGIDFERFGGFLNFSASGGYIPSNEVAGEYSQDGNIYHLYGVSAKSAKDKDKSGDFSMAIIFGVDYRLIQNLFINIGLGPEFHEEYHLFSLDGNDKWLTNKEGGGFIAQAGLRWFFKFFYISANYQHHFRNNTPTFNITAGLANGTPTVEDKKKLEADAQRLKEEEARRQREAREAEEARQREARKAEATRQNEAREAEKRERQDASERAYANALAVSGVDKIKEYISVYRYTDYFNRDSYIEIARRIVNARNIKFDNLTMTGNPYAYEKDTIYFYHYNIGVRQWLPDGGILCYIGNHALVLEEVPNVRNIKEVISNSYLRYNGTSTLQFVNGKTEVIPVFNLIYSFN
jgi:hypothetical protein